MSSKSPLTESISRIESDSARQAHIEAHRDRRTERILKHREKVNDHLSQVEQQRTDALERAHVARQAAYEKAGIAANPVITKSEARILKSLDKSEVRRAEALQKVQARQMKIEERTDRHLAKIESRGHDIREKHTNDRELRHFNRDHKKEARQEGHVESAKELALRLKREAHQRDNPEVLFDAGDSYEVSFTASDDEEMDLDEAATLVEKEKRRAPGVFTVKTSSED